MENVKGGKSPAVQVAKASQPASLPASKPASQPSAWLAGLVGVFEHRQARMETKEKGKKITSNKPLEYEVRHLQAYESQN
eukprot:14406688-Heterocapsa_arctica.AAC.1